MINLWGLFRIGPKERLAPARVPSYSSRDKLKVSPIMYKTYLIDFLHAFTNLHSVLLPQMLNTPGLS